MTITNLTQTSQLVEFVRRETTRKEVGLSESTINELVAKGLFPQPVKIGTRASGFIRSELEAWKKARIAERDSSQTI